MTRSSDILRAVLCVFWGACVAAGAFAECDVAPPALVDFDFTPTSGDATFGDVDVTCTMTLTDALSGASTPECTFTSPLFFQRQSCTAGAPLFGTPQSGTYECTLTIPRYADPGVWTASVRLEDGVGNEVSLQNFDLAIAGHPTELTIASNPDFAGPVLTNLSLTPDAVNVDAADRTVTCAMTLTDSPAGVKEVTCQLQSPDAGQFAACIAAAPSSGDRNNGVFSCDATISRYADAGQWSAQVTATDEVGSVGFFFQGMVTVTSTNEDIAGPTLVDFSFAPSTADTGSSAVVVTCDMEITDAPAGTRFAACTFLGPGGVQEQACFADVPTTGTTQNGTYRCDAVLPAYSEGGSWEAGVSLLDRTWNGTGLLGTDLAGMGFPDALTVDCGAVATPQPVLRWDSATTLAWDAIAGAIRYNTYRGFLSALPFDYGSCQNGRDPVPTDTTFTETEDPPQGTGYQFLVSVTDGSGEGSLGSASDGTTRMVFIPCP